jgi:PAS domain S-box-containing protein
VDSAPLSAVFARDEVDLAPSAPPIRPEPRPPRSPFHVGRALIASFAGLAVLLAIVGWAIERRMRAELRSRALGQLSALADLKVDRIAAWRAERLADAAAIAAPPVGDDGLSRLARGEPSPAVAAWYRQIRERHLYADVLVVSPRGELLFSAAGQRGPLDPTAADVASRALAGGRAVLSDMYRSGRDGRVYLDAAAPIPAPGGGAAFVLRSDAETLYPLVREWPGSTRTAEALLVRREGDDALFLSDLRHERGAALEKRISLARTDVVSVQAARGSVGVREGVDYRGVPVLADIRAVPDSTWWLVAKVDRDEIFETERHLAWAAWAALSAFVALGGLLAATWVRAERHRRSAAERAALDEAARYRAEVLANVGDGVISTDAEGRITSWNRGAERIFGWTEAEALGRKVPELLRDEYGPAQSRAWVLAELEREGRSELAVRRHRKDGTPLDIEATVVARRDGAGNLLGYIGVYRDVTERRRGEEENARLYARLERSAEALRRSEAYLAEAQTLTHTGTWAADGKSRKTTYWSEELFRMYGCDPQGGIPDAQEQKQRTHPDDRDRVEEHTYKTFLDKRDCDIEFRIVLPDGAVKHIHALAHPVLGPEGELVEVVGTSIDVTERKRAEAERERLRQLEADLARASRITTMSELTASLAHEIRQPVAAASTNARACVRWLAREHPDLGEARAAADRIVADTNRAAQIVERVRSLYKKGAPARAAVDANEVARETLTLFLAEAERYGISLRAELAPDLPSVEADRVQLQQVFMNLIVNAIEAMHGTGGELCVTSERGKDGELLFSVSDTGAGLPAERADAVFDAFFTTKPQGTGMGLRISRSIVEAHGGRLWAASGARRGATFCFNLPANGHS